MYSERTISDLIGDIYATVTDPSLWPSFLNKFADVCGAEIGTLYVQDLQTSEGSFELTNGMDPTFRRSYQAYYAPKNVYLSRGRHLLRAGNITISDELCPKAQVVKSEFYNDWILPQKLGEGLNAVLFSERSLVGSAGAIRAHNAKPFTVGDKQLLGILLPHLERVIQLRRQISALELRVQTSHFALDHWSTGVLLVDMQSRVLSANQNGKALLDRKDGLRVEQGRLAAMSAHETEGLHRLIRDTASVVCLNNRGRNSLMCVSRALGKHPLNLFVSPSVRQDLFFGTPGTALVFVSDPEAAISQNARLQHLYGLTAAEANIAALLASGRDVHAISDELSIRENTVRIHLKRIFDKTGTKRQAELVRLVLAGPATLQAPS